MTSLGYCLFWLVGSASSARFLSLTRIQDTGYRIQDTALDCSAMLQLSVSYESCLLFLINGFHRGVKLVAAQMVGLDNESSTSSESLSCSSSEEDIHELYV